MASPLPIERTPSHEFRTWGYMEPLYQYRIEALLETTSSAQCTQVLLHVLQAIQQGFFQNPGQFQLSDQMVRELQQCKLIQPVENLLACFRGDPDADEELLNFELFRDTPHPGRMAVKQEQRAALLQGTEKIVTAAITILQERTTWTKQQFETFKKEQLEEQAKIAVAQAAARKRRAELDVVAQSRRQLLESEKARLLALVAENGMNVTQIVGTPFELDEEIALRAVQQNGMAWNLVPVGILEADDYHVITFAAIHQTEAVMELLSREQKSSPQFIGKAFACNRRILSYLSEHLTTNRRVVECMLDTMEARLREREGVLSSRHEIMNCIYSIHDLIVWSKHKNDEQLVMRAFKYIGTVTERMSDGLKYDIEFIITLCNVYGNIFIQIGDNLQSMDRFTLDVYRLNPLFLMGIEERGLRIPAEIFVHGIKQNPMILAILDCTHPKYLTRIHEALNEIAEECTQAAKRNDLDQTLVCIRHHHLVVRYTNSQALVQHKDVVFFLQSLHKIFATAVMLWKEDESRMLQVVKACGEVLEYIPQAAENESFLLHILYQYGFLLCGAPQRYRVDEPFILRAARISRDILWGADTILRNNREYVLKVIECNYATIAGAGYNLRNDLSFLVDALQRDIRVIEHASSLLRETVQVTDHGGSIEILIRMLKESRV